MPLLLAQQSTALVSLSSNTAIAALLAVIAALLAFALWFLQREIKNNDAAHRELKREITDTRRELKADIKAVEADVKAVGARIGRVEASLARIEGLLDGMLRGAAGREASAKPPQTEGA